MIDSAGGVPYRYDRAGRLMIALVHRPRYDDWSLPKGRLDQAEAAVAGAVREVAEETGQLTRAARPLGELRYDTSSGGKRVRYWTMAAEGGVFAPSREVDQICWLPPDEALERLHPDRDRSILRAFLDDHVDTWPLVVVRHAHAGSRETWRGEDAKRPLERRGRRQAKELQPILAAYGVCRLVSAPAARCRQTLAPYAEARGLSIEIDQGFSEDGYGGDPQTAQQRLLELAVMQQPTAVCSQGKVIPDLLRCICPPLGATPITMTLAKGGYCVLHLTGATDLRLVALEVTSPAA